MKLQTSHMSNSRYGLTLRAPEFMAVFFLRPSMRRRYADWAHRSKSGINRQTAHDTPPQFQGRVLF